MADMELLLSAMKALIGAVVTASVAAVLALWRRVSGLESRIIAVELHRQTTQEILTELKKVIEKVAEEVKIQGDRTYEQNAIAIERQGVLLERISRLEGQSNKNG